MKNSAEVAQYLQDVVEFSGKLRFIIASNERVLRLPEPGKGPGEPDAG